MAPAIAIERADRKVDAAGGDDQRHADGDDDDGRDLGQVHVERLPGQEVRRDRDVEDQQSRKQRSSVP